MDTVTRHPVLLLLCTVQLGQTGWIPLERNSKSVIVEQPKYRISEVSHFYQYWSTNSRIGINVLYHG